MGDQMRCPVTVEEKGNVTWADDGTRKMSYTKCAFALWNIIMMGRGFIYWYIHWELETKTVSQQTSFLQTALSKYFWNWKDQELTPQIKWKIVGQSSTMISFNGRCNSCINEKISIINYKDCRLLLNERNKLLELLIPFDYFWVN